MVSASEVVTGAIAPSIAPDYLQALHQPDHRHLFRLASFIGLYISAVGLIHYFTPASDWLGPPLCWPLYLLAAAALHGISLFVHEGVHGVLLPQPWANRLLSMACALPVWQNFAAYRRLHLQHHAHLGQVGDPDHYRNYTQWSWLEFLMHWGRLLIGYPVYIVMIPILGWQQGDRADRCGIAAEIGLLITTIIAIRQSSIPPSYLIHGWLIPMLIVNTIVNIRGMSQHTLLEHESESIRGSRTLLCDPVTRFFMCNENYHLEHHLYPGVPWYNLPHLHRALQSSLRAQGATYLRSYGAFVREFTIASLSSTTIGSVALLKLIN